VDENIPQNNKKKFWADVTKDAGVDIPQTKYSRGKKRARKPL